MSRQLVGHSPDLKRLQDEGYDIEVSNSNYLLVRVPYVTSGKQVARGTLVSEPGSTGKYPRVCRQINEKVPSELG